MSVWGPLPYENDDAADWLADLDDEPEMALVHEAFDEVLGVDAPRYLEVTEGAQAVAAAAVVADLLEGLADDELIDPDSLEVLAEQARRMHPSAVASTAWRACRALAVVSRAEGSELAELVAEDPEISSAWDAHVADLLRRLAPYAAWPA